MTKKLSGILAAVSTPFGTDGLVDEARLQMRDVGLGEAPSGAGGTADGVNSHG